MTHVPTFDATLSSGLWEGLSFRPGGCESDETRWRETSLVFTDVRKGGLGGIPRGETPGWGRDEPPSAIYRLCGRGISMWRGRPIHFALRGFVVPAAVNGGSSGTSGDGGGGGGGLATGSLLRITLIKRHLGAYSNIVHYEGTLSANGCAIQGTFPDGAFRLRQIDSINNVLARELTGAWDGESSYRRGGQSTTAWKAVRLTFSRMPSGDVRGLLVTGGGASIWKDQRIPFCVTGRLSLPGLEVELEKQHIEGYHNRIAYFGRVLSGAGADKVSGPGFDCAPSPIRLVGVYEHGDFALHRTRHADFADANGRIMLGHSPGSSKAGRRGEPSVLEACIELFRRCADTNSIWGKAGLHRANIMPPMARSYSGEGPWVPSLPHPVPPPLPPPPPAPPLQRSERPPGHPGAGPKTFLQECTTSPPPGRRSAWEEENLDEARWRGGSTGQLRRVPSLPLMKQGGGMEQARGGCDDGGEDSGGRGSGNLEMSREFQGSRQRWDARCLAPEVDVTVRVGVGQDRSSVRNIGSTAMWAGHPGGVRQGVAGVPPPPGMASRDDGGPCRSPTQVSMAGGGDRAGREMVPFMSTTTGRNGAPSEGDTNKRNEDIMGDLLLPSRMKGSAVDGSRSSRSGDVYSSIFDGDVAHGLGTAVARDPLQRSSAGFGTAKFESAFAGDGATATEEQTRPSDGTLPHDVPQGSSQSVRIPRTTGVSARTPSIADRSMVLATRQEFVNTSRRAGVKRGDGAAYEAEGSAPGGHLGAARAVSINGNFSEVEVVPVGGGGSMQDTEALRMFTDRGGGGGGRGGWPLWENAASTEAKLEDREFGTGSRTALGNLEGVAEARAGVGTNSSRAPSSDADVYVAQGAVGEGSTFASSRNEFRNCCDPPKSRLWGDGPNDVGVRDTGILREMILTRPVDARKGEAAAAAEGQVPGFNMLHDLDVRLAGASIADDGRPQGHSTIMRESAGLEENGRVLGSDNAHDGTDQAKLVSDFSSVRQNELPMLHAGHFDRSVSEACTSDFANALVVPGSATGAATTSAAAIRSPSPPGQAENSAGLPAAPAVAPGVTLSSGGRMTSKETECTVCARRPVDALLLPCGHLCVCASCSSTARSCPICRSDILRVQPVFRG